MPVRAAAVATGGPGPAIAGRFKSVTLLLRLSAHPTPPAAQICSAASRSECARRRAPSCCSVRGTFARPVAHCGLPAGPGRLLLAGSNLQRFSCASRRTPHHQPLRSVRPHPVLSARVVAHRPAALYEARSLAQSLIATSRAAGRTPVKHSALPSSHARSCCSVCCWPSVYLLQPRQYSSARAG